MGRNAQETGVHPTAIFHDQADMDWSAQTVTARRRMTVRVIPVQNLAIELGLLVLVQGAHSHVPDPLSSHRCLQASTCHRLSSRGSRKERQDTDWAMSGWGVLLQTPSGLAKGLVSFLISGGTTSDLIG
jgi:hypothetical protein